MLVYPVCGALCDAPRGVVVPCVVTSTLNVWCLVWCGDGASPGEAGTQDDGEGTEGIISCHNACQLFLHNMISRTLHQAKKDVSHFLGVGIEL